MTNKRLLFLISSESEINEASKFAKAIKEYIKGIETYAVYVKDITKYEILPTNINGLGMINSTAMVMGEYKNFENDIYENIKEKAIEYFDKVYSVTGSINETIMEELKAYDGLVIVKDDGNITPALKELLGIHYKPLIILGKKETDYKFNKVLMLNDGGYKVNRSVFSYFNLFGEEKIDVLRVNVEDRDRLSERFGNICNVIDETGEDVSSIIAKYVTNYDIILMGDLNYSILLERLTGQTGLKVIESSNNPIFIG